MDYKSRKKVHDLRMDILNFFFNSKHYCEHLEIEAIDYIISTLYSFDITFANVREYLKNNDVINYSKFNYIYKQKDVLLSQVLDLKKEIVKKTCNNEYYIRNSHKLREYVVHYDDMNDIEIVKFGFEMIICYLERLEKLLEKYNIPKLKNFSIFVRNISDCYNDVCSSYCKNNKSRHEEEKDDDEDELEDEDYFEISSDEVKQNDTWVINRKFNYDDNKDIIDDAYINIFRDEEYKPQYEALIGVIISDFYEYYKSNEYLYIDDEDDDITELLCYIEENDTKTISEQFIDDPSWGEFILDSYIYYNINYSPIRKLKNRQKIRDMGMLGILKKHNKFIDDTLIDETLYNVDVLTLSEIIRVMNGCLYDEFDNMDNISNEELLFKYFTTNYIPKDMKDIIPVEIEDININLLKRLQLRFIISDIFSRELYKGNKNIDDLLDKNPDDLYNSIISNPDLLRMYIKDFVDEIDNYKNLDLSNEQKEKIMKFNKLSALDNI